MSESESALESDDEEQGLTVVPSSKAKRGARAGVGGGAAAGRSDTCNEAAILRKLEQLRGGVDTESDDAAWLETLDITASEREKLERRSSQAARCQTPSVPEATRSRTDGSSQHQPAMHVE